MNSNDSLRPNGHTSSPIYDPSKNRVQNGHYPQTSYGQEIPPTPHGMYENSYAPQTIAESSYSYGSNYNTPYPHAYSQDFFYPSAHEPCVATKPEPDESSKSDEFDDDAPPPDHYGMRMRNDAYLAKELKNQIESNEKLYTEVRAAKEYLSRMDIQPIYPSPLVIPSNEILNCVTSEMIDLASNFTLEPYDDIGVLSFILTCFSIATRGRVTINVSEIRTEFTSLMSIHTCKTNAQIDHIVAQLAKPFETFQKKQEALMPSNEAIFIAKEMKQALNQKAKMEIRQITKDEQFLGDPTDAYENILKECYQNRKKYDATLEKKLPQIFFEKGTLHNFIQLLSEQGEATAYISAHGALLKDILRPSSGFPEIINKLYAQEATCYNTAKPPIRLNSPAGSIVSFVPPDTMINFYDNMRLQNLGTSALFLPYFHSGQKMFPTPRNICVNLYHKYKQKIFSLLKLYYTQNPQAQRYSVYLTPEARALIQNYHVQLKARINASDLSATEPALCRLPSQAIRLAWSIHVWNHDVPHQTPITHQEVLAAIALCEVFEQHINYAYSPTGLKAHKHACILAKRLQKINSAHGNDELSHGYLSSRSLEQGTKLKKDEIQNAAELLQRYNWLRIIYNGEGILRIIPNPRIMKIDWS